MQDVEFQDEKVIIFYYLYLFGRYQLLFDQYYHANYTIKLRKPKLLGCLYYCGSA